MPEEERSALINRDLTAKIISAYLQHNRLGADQIGPLIATVHQTLGRLGTPPEAPTKRTPAVPVRQSVQRDYVVCLECGYRGWALRRHLTTHGLTVEEYRARWNLPRNHPIVAPAYRERRSQLAKQIGLGRGHRAASRG